MFLRNHDAYDRTAVNREGLKELRSLAEGLWVLNNDANCTGACTIRNLYPVPAEASKLVVYDTEYSTSNTIQYKSSPRLSISFM